MELSELGKKAEALYQHFRAQLETEANIGKIVVFDVDSEDYELDTTGLESSRRLRERHPAAWIQVCGMVRSALCRLLQWGSAPCSARACWSNRSYE